MFRNLSVAARLSLVALLVTLLSLTVTAGAGLYRGNTLAEEIAEAGLVTGGASQARDIESTFLNLRREVAALALSPGAARSIEALRAAYAELAEAPEDPDLEEALVNHYLVDVVPQLEAVRGGPVAVTSLFPEEPAAIRLQSLYVVPYTTGTGDDASEVDPALVFDPGDGSRYSEIHERVHDAYGTLASLSGFDDLFLIDAELGTILYSVRKRTDFATSLELGPLSGTGLANLVDRLGDVAESGVTSMTDYAAYAPAFDRPAAFIGSPVVDDGRLVGFLVAAVDTSAIDAVLAEDSKGQILGETGEIYVAGSDAIMRSTARPFAEDPGTFLATSADATPPLDDDQRRRIRETGTTALVQPVNRRTVDDALTASSISETVNYRGESVASASSRLAVDEVDWVIISEVSSSELDAPIEDYARQLLFAVAVFVVAVTFVAVRWSGRVMAPIRSIATRLRAARGMESAADVDPGVPADSPVEFRELSTHIDDMLERLDDREREVGRRHDERVGLLRQFLPDTVARRAEAGAVDVLDHVRSATAVVVVLHDVDSVVEQLHRSDVGDILGRLVDEVDALATDFGLERAKITGNAYVAVCGVTRPHLDHVPRSVGFALAARELAEEIVGEVAAEIAAEHGAPPPAADGDSEWLHVSIGVDTGSVSVGLAGRSGLVYDAWGDAVSGANDLARRAPTEGVAVTDRVRRQLPDDFTIGDTPVPVEGAALVIGLEQASEVGS